MILRYIHIPKTGGTSVLKFLQENNVNFLHGELRANKIRKGHGKAKDWKTEKSFKFATVRNPYSRIVSYYNFTKTENWRPSFYEFVTNKMINTNLNVPNVWVPQAEWVTDENGDCLIDKLFKLEDNLESNLKTFLKINSNSFPKENVSTTDDYNSYYNEELKEIIFQRFKCDFDLLEYAK